MGVGRSLAWHDDEFWWAPFGFKVCFFPLKHLDRHREVGQAMSRKLTELEGQVQSARLPQDVAASWERGGTRVGKTSFGGFP